ncbi:hypothetical protein D9619_013514 [Psilocybe cf. subviscida]|uniref:Uncharacterized protein n=1 Tax=Psilocybe cf. subviscida TaxID=2480587 RepID=A0A8H5BHL1_9AGAR|nr:hypothetical protein D9619_013514 [Psilocybe cf. subviscida]
MLVKPHHTLRAGSTTSISPSRTIPRYDVRAATPATPLAQTPSGASSSSSHPYDTYETNVANPYSAPTSVLHAPGGPPPVPQLLQQEQRYLTPSPYKFADDGQGGMRTAMPMIAPHAQRVGRSILPDMGDQDF